MIQMHLLLFMLGKLVIANRNMQQVRLHASEPTGDVSGGGSSSLS